MGKSDLVLVAAMVTLGIAATAAAQSLEQNGYTLRQTVRNVPIEVVVTDKDGKPVRGLKQSDFTITEDKAPQRILSFEYEDGSVPSFVPPKLPPLPPNTFVNVPNEAEFGPLYVLYYDLVNTRGDLQMFFRPRLLNCLETLPPGARVALFVNMAGLHLLQGFTTDRAALRDAILAKGPGPHIPDDFLYGDVYGAGDTGAALSNLKFMAEYLSKLEVTLMVGVGAAFDFLSASKPQAPRWMMPLGLEWCFRLATEPRRLWKRYLKHNPRFLVFFALQLLGWKHRKLQTP